MSSLNKLIILQKIVQSTAGLLLGIMVIIFLSPSEQGYFYAMGSILNSYVLLDMGLSSLLLQKSAKFFSKLGWDNKNNIVNNGGKNKDETIFISFLSWALSWYKVLSYLTFIILPIGFIYFHFSTDGSLVNWQLPWGILVLSYALCMPAIGFFSIMEGAKKITQIYIYRCFIYLLSIIVSICMMFLGFGLFSHAAVPLSTILVYIVIKNLYFKDLILRTKTTGIKFDWKKTILPQQKKVCVNWISNFLFQHIPVPLVFFFLDPEIAGKFGISMIFANISLAIAFTPITAITPKFSSYAVLNSSQALKIFTAHLYKSIFLASIGIVTVYFLMQYAQEFSISQRILNPFEILLLFISYGIFYLNSSFVSFFRAYDLEPFSFPILLTIIFILIFGALLLYYDGLASFIYAILFFMLALSVYSVSYFFRHSNKYD